MRRASFSVYLRLVNRNVTVGIYAMMKGYANLYRVTAVREILNHNDSSARVRRSLAKALFWFCCLNMIACRPAQENKASPPASSTQALQSLTVSVTDTAVSFQPNAQHLYYDCADRCVDDQVLFVFLPGSDGSPGQYRKILEVIGATGIRAIGLAYQNNGSLASICGTDDACYTQARRDRVVGAAGSSYVASAADGIQNRLSKALVSLGWSQFFSGSSIAYEKLIIGGFSQGAGMAAWIGKKMSVARICQFSGPWDHLTGTTPASWLKESSATPTDRFYGFAHYDDSLPKGVTYLNLNWQVLGMGTGSDIPLYTNPSGQKLTAQDTDLSCVADAHACSVVDSATPVEADGTPRYASAWRFVCGRP